MANVNVDTVVSVAKNQENVGNDYVISRKEAADLLKMSVRTVDRYIKQGKLSTQFREGRKWLSKKEIGLISGGKKAFSKLVNVDKVDRGGGDVYVETSPPNNGDIVQTVSPLPQKMSTSPFENQDLNNSYSKTGIEDQVYKKLYQELSTKFSRQQERLEGANYRVGQLEAQIKQAVPLLQYNQEKKLALEETKAFKEKLNSYQYQVEKQQSKINSFRLEKSKMAKDLKVEKIAKTIYLVILFTLLILQPLWLWISIQK